MHKPTRQISAKVLRLFERADITQHQPLIAQKECGLNYSIIEGSATNRTLIVQQRSRDHSDQNEPQDEPNSASSLDVKSITIVDQFVSYRSCCEVRETGFVLKGTSTQMQHL
jgi:hypothetical protein